MLLERVVLGQKVRAELLLRGGDLLVDLLKPCLGGLVKVHTVAGETLVELLENHLLLSRKSALVSVIDSLDTLEERLVHRDVVLVLGHQRGGLLDNFVHLIAAFCLLKVEQHGRRLGQSLAGQLVSRHGVLKRRRILIVQDSLKFLVLLLNPGLDGRNVIGKLNLLERRNAVRCVPFLQERIVLCLCAGCHHSDRS